jgi:hypothetical protein
MSDASQTALVPIEKLTPVEIYAPEAVTQLLDRIERAARQAAQGLDASTEQGRDGIRSLAHQIAKRKVWLDKQGLALTEEWRSGTKRVNEERKRVVTTLDSLQEDIRRPLTEYETRDKRRVEAHEAALAALVAAPGVLEAMSLDALRARLAALENPEPARDWEEFSDRARSTVAAEVGRTMRLLDAAEKREREVREREQLRAENAERGRVAGHYMAIDSLGGWANRARDDMDSRDWREALKGLLAAFQARDWQEFADKAGAEFDAAKATIEREIEACEAREKKFRESREAEIAERAAVEARRQADEAAAAREAEARGAAEAAENRRIKDHKGWLGLIRSYAEPPHDKGRANWQSHLTSTEWKNRLRSLNDLPSRNWEEFAGEAAQARAEVGVYLGEQQEAAEQREAAEAAAAEAKRLADREAAQAAAVAAAREADEKARQAQAYIDAENKRKADLAAQKASENRAHRKRVNEAAVGALMVVAGLSEKAAEAAIAAIAKGEIPRVAIEY